MESWIRFDRKVLRATQHVLFLLGMIFVGAVCAEVFSRFFLETSLYFLNALTLLLLVWFFLLGAGPALREGAHVGFDLLMKHSPPAVRRIGAALSATATLCFFLVMIWSGFVTLRPSLQQMNSSLGVSNLWVMLAFPVGFALLTYHQIALFVLPPPDRVDA